MQDASDAANEELFVFDRLHAVKCHAISNPIRVGIKPKATSAMLFRRSMGAIISPTY
jgi:hypothetical protein